MSTPILPFASWSAGTNQNSIPANDNSRRNQILNGEVISKAVTAQPAGVEGAIYILAATHTGAQWAGFDPDDLVIYSGGTWYAFAPVEGVVVNFDGHQEQYTGSSGWDEISGTPGGAGTVMSVDASGGVETVAGTPITATGTIRVSRPVNAQTGTTYTYLTGDRGKLVTHSNAAAIAGTLPQATGTFPAGWAMIVKNKGAGTLTITPTTSTIDGAATLALTTGQWAEIVSDGTNYQATIYAPAGGGGSITGFTSALNTSGPNTGTNISSLTASGGTTNQDAAFIPKGTGAIVAAIADSGTGGGNKRGANAFDFQVVRASAGQAATGVRSVIVGGRNNTAVGTDAVVVGGNENQTSGSGESFVGGGQLNTASGTRSTVVGGVSNTASNTNAGIVSGTTNTASGDASFIGGGTLNTASGDNSFVAGGHQATTRGIRGAGAHASGQFGALGDAQTTVHVLRLQTSATGANSLSSAGAAPAATTTAVLPNSGAFAFRVLVVAEQNTLDAAAWQITGLIKRGANAAATALVGTPTVTQLAADAGAAAWTCVAIANTTLGSLDIQVNQNGSGFVRWVARVELVETAW